MASGKTYGLIIPKKTGKKQVIAKPSIFGDDDEDNDPDALAKAVRKLGTESKLKRKTQLEIDAALQENPDVYEYDTIYDKMQEERKAKFAGPEKSKEKDTKPRYIENLMKTAAHRKREHERRMERTVQREREEEKDKYDDSESFVTGAYRQKMAEMAAEEEEERRKEIIEERLDVTKQKDLSGFYRHLLRQTTSTDPNKSEVKVEIKQEDTVKSEPQDRTHPEDKDASSSESSDDSGSDSADRRNHQTNRSQTSDRRRSRSRDRKHRRHRSRSRDRDNRHVSDRHQEDKSPAKLKQSGSSSISHRSPDAHQRSKPERSSRSDDKRSVRSPDRRAEREKEKSQEKQETDKREKELQEVPETSKRHVTEKSDEPKAGDNALKFSKRNVGDSVNDAKARYLARKQGRVVPVARDPAGDD